MLKQHSLENRHGLDSILSFPGVELMSVLSLQVHLFGASLGGFLAQKYAEFSGNGRRVQSMILCNSFNDTDVFQQKSSSSGFVITHTVTY